MLLETWSIGSGLVVVVVVVVNINFGDGRVITFYFIYLLVILTTTITIIQRVGGAWYQQINVSLLYSYIFTRNIAMSVFCDFRFP